MNAGLEGFTGNLHAVLARLDEAVTDEPVTVIAARLGRRLGRGAQDCCRRGRADEADHRAPAGGNGRDKRSLCRCRKRTLRRCAGSPG